MVVTVSDVRTYLNDIPASLVPDTVITKMISLATSKVDKEKSSKASTTDLDMAILVLAGHMTYLGYSSKLERGIGTRPPAVDNQLLLYKSTADQFLDYIRRGEPVTPLRLELPISLYDEE